MVSADRRHCPDAAAASLPTTSESRPPARIRLRSNRESCTRPAHCHILCHFFGLCWNNPLGWCTVSSWRAPAYLSPAYTSFPCRSTWDAPKLWNSKFSKNKSWKYFCLRFSSPFLLPCRQKARNTSSSLFLASSLSPPRQPSSQTYLLGSFHYFSYLCSPVFTKITQILCFHKYAV